MKTFQQFMETPEIVNIMKGFAQQNKKPPQELKGMRDKVIGGVVSNLGSKMDFNKLIKKIPDSNEMSNKFRKAETGLKNKLNDPATQQKFNNIFRMIDSVAGKKKSILQIGNIILVNHRNERKNHKLYDKQRNVVDS